MTIHVAPGLSARLRRTAIELGPPAVDGPDDLGDAVAAAGFGDVEVVDVTDRYRATLGAWIERWDADIDHLERLFGGEVVRDRQSERRRSLAAIDDGLLRRTLVSATRR